MPVTHFACPPGKPTYGEVHEPEHCITKCQHRCMSPYLMAAIVASNQKNHHKGKYVSATALSACVRKLQNERTLDYAEYYHNLYYAFRGTVTHTVLEEAVGVKLGEGKSLEDLGFLSEWRMQIGFCFRHGGFRVPATLDASNPETWVGVACPGCVKDQVPPEESEWFILGGTLDGLEPVWELFKAKSGILPAKLHDLKTMQEYAITYFVKGDAGNTLHPQVKDAYVQQARVYRYLAEMSEPPEILKRRGVKKIKMIESHIQAFAMGHAPWTGGGTFRWKDHYRNPLKDWPMHPVDLGTTAWVESYIRTQARPIYDSLILNKVRGPIIEPEVDSKGKPESSSKGSHSWACDFCAFHASDYCPNPRLEWEQLQAGADPETAFAAALAQPYELPEDKVGELTEKDLANMTAYLAKQKKAS